MTEKHRYLVQASFACIIPKANKASEHFYKRLYELDSSLRLFFIGNPMDNYLPMMNMMYLCVNSLDNMNAADELVFNLGERYCRLGVEERHYDMAGDALLWSLSQVLGDSFTEDIREAWIQTFSMYACRMKAAHKQFEERRQMEFVVRLYAA